MGLLDVKKKLMLDLPVVTAWMICVKSSGLLKDLLYVGIVKWKGFFEQM